MIRQKPKKPKTQNRINKERDEDRARRSRIISRTLEIVLTQNEGKE